MPMANAMGMPIISKTTNKITTSSTFTPFRRSRPAVAGQTYAVFTALISLRIVLMFNPVVMDMSRLPIGTLRVTQV